MDIRGVVCGLLLTAWPTVALANPPGGEYSLYWSEPESQAYVSITQDSYRVSGRYVAVMTYEETPPAGHHALLGEVYDCSGLQYVLAESIEYDAENHEVSSHSSKNITNRFKPIEEDSRQEFLLIGLCDEEGGRPTELATARAYFQNIAEHLSASEQ